MLFCLSSQNANGLKLLLHQVPVGAFLLADVGHFGGDQYSDGRFSIHRFIEIGLWVESIQDAQVNIRRGAQPMERLRRRVDGLRQRLLRSLQIKTRHRGANPAESIPSLLHPAPLFLSTLRSGSNDIERGRIRGDGYG